VEHAGRLMTIMMIGGSNHNDNRPIVCCFYKYNSRRRQIQIQRGRTVCLTIMAMIVMGNVLCWSSSSIMAATAFIVVTPTTTTRRTHPTITITRNSHRRWDSARIIRGEEEGRRISRIKTATILTAVDSSSSSSGGGENGDQNKKNIKLSSPSPSPSSSNSNSNSNRKYNKVKNSDDGGGNYRKKKSATTSKSKTKTNNRNRNRKNNNNNNPKKKKATLDPSREKKREIIQQIKATNKNTNQRQDGKEDGMSSNINNNNDKDIDQNKKNNLFMVNPFQAGKNFRDTLGTLTTLGRGLQLPKETKQKYFLDDRLLDVDDGSTSTRTGSRGGLGGIGGIGNFKSLSSLFGNDGQTSTASTAPTTNANRLLRDYAAASDEFDTNTYIPEVLVIGATGEVGRLVVRRLLLEGQRKNGNNNKFRIRVLVRDLYSQTLNLLGTGVSYCQGDLNNIESLEYALTDVDKIIYVAGSPRSDESNFQTKFQSFIYEHGSTNMNMNMNMNISRSSLQLLTEEQQQQQQKISAKTKQESNGNNTTTTTTTDTTQTSSSSSSSPITSLDNNDLDGNNKNNMNIDNNNNNNNNNDDIEWEQLSNMLEVRAQLAEQVDYIGMKNLVSAYQNVRVTDYGTSQAAKRSLFKFSRKIPKDDFNLFTILLDDDDDNNSDNNNYYYDEEPEDDEYDAVIDYSDNKDDEDYDYDEDDENDNYGLMLESRNAAKNTIVKTQVQWLRNKFHNGVFVGKVPKATIANLGSGGEAAIISSRLRAREDPNLGIDMTNFAGFILRLVSDGNNYEVFVRTGSYETDGIEYVYEFGTDSKRPTAENKSHNRFKTVRLAFDNFKPIQRQKYSNSNNIKIHNTGDNNNNDATSSSNDKNNDDDDIYMVQPFTGSDVRYFGFRFRSSSNMEVDNNRIRKQLQQRMLGGSNSNSNDENFQSFYLALSYIKVYRAQPDPEFIYLSDARIPPIIRDGMVDHQRRLLLTDDEATTVNTENKKNKKRKKDDGSDRKNDNDLIATTTTLLDEKDLQQKSQLERSPEETYFKYRGEEILIKSGLSYTIIRVAGFNELSTSEASTIDLVKSNTDTDIVPVSRAEVAQVCVSALLDPSALNKSVYMTKKKVAGKNVLDEEDISAKFDAIPSDKIL
jgi:uncharacterized protein YbjT (DUF2867 family)